MAWRGDHLERWRGWESGPWPKLLVVAAVAALTGGGWCARVAALPAPSATSAMPATSAGGEAAPRGCILISIDTLRYDHLGCDGYALPTSPRIDRFRQDAVLFVAAIAQAPSTLASHASLLTSLLPPQHGASFKNGTALAPGVLTLAELLRRRGIATASFNDGGQISPEFGLGRGFDRYRSQQVGPRTAHLATQVAQTIAWLRQHPAQPFFLFLHTYEVHHPYTPDAAHLALFETGPYRGPLPATETSFETLARINDGYLRLGAGDLRHVTDTYDGEIREMDDAFGSLIEFLVASGLYDQTAILFTSDHGEEFGEHGKVGWHSHTLYDELLRVPLLIKYPGSAHAGGTVTRQVRSIDLAPTVLRLMELPAAAAFQGRDLTPLVQGHVEPARLAVGNLDGGGVPAIRTQGWKLIANHLFDLVHDPGETLDVSARYPDIAAFLAARRDALLAGAPPARGPVAHLSARATAELASLGYIDAGGPVLDPD
jgi:arylsulfatase A-like enzyme